MGVTFRQAAAQDSRHAEMLMYNAAQTVTIFLVNVYHAILGFIAGLKHGWIFNAGSIGGGDITTASGGAAININDVAHGLVTGDYIAIQSSNHTGVEQVTKIDDDNFTVPIAYVGDQVCNWQQGSYLEAQAGAEGDYAITLAMSGESISVNHVFKWEVYRNSLAIGSPNDKVVSERKHTNTDIGTLPGTGVVPNVVAGDRIWLASENKTGVSNFTIEHININLVRI